MSKKNVESLKFLIEYEADSLDTKYGSNGLLLYALSLHFGIEDIDAFAADSLTDGSDDKKLDVCYISEEDGILTLAQGYLSQTWGKPAAPAKKASDLITAAAWLFSADLESVPERLKTKVVEARSAINSQSINRVDVFYVHNCFESINVEKELSAATAGIRDILRTAVNKGDEIVVTYKEIGLSAIEELFSRNSTEISVDSWIDLPVTPFIEEQGSGWRGIALSIPGSWIRDLFIKYQDRLFSANFRDFMGAPSRKENINFQIKQTAASEPENFWVYNNGITALTWRIDTTSNPPRVHGISIINGAQTSGAIGESSAENAEKTKINLRIVESKSEALISKAILYTNTQNEIKPFDRKSNDPLQVKLKDSFAHYGLTYLHRRSQARVPRGSITANALGVSLCAFHGDPQTAYRNSRDIFSKNDTYDMVFQNVSAEHAFLVHTLSSAIDQTKLHLKARISEGKATKSEETQYNILRFSPSKHFLMYVIGEVSEQLLNKRITNRKFWRVKQDNVKPNSKRVLEAWRDVLDVVLPNLSLMMGDESSIYEIERSAAESKKYAEKLSVSLASLESLYAPKFKEIRAITIT